MKSILSIFFVAFIVFISSDIFSQSPDEKAKTGVEYVYHLKFDSAKIIFDDLIKEQPQNPRGYFLLTLIEWWKINLNREDFSNDENFVSKVEKVEEIADNALDKNDKDDNAMFYKGAAIGFRGLMRSFRESWFKAAEDGREALNLLQSALDVNPSNKEGLFGIGVYNYFAEYVPERYPVVKPLLILFPSGNKAQGLLQIQETSNSSNIAGTEAKYILAYLNLRYEKNYIQSEMYSKELSDKYPENPIFRKYLYESYYRLGKYQEAYDGWKLIIQRAEDNLPWYQNDVKREGYYNAAVSLIKLGKILEAEPLIVKSLELTRSGGKENTPVGAYTYLIVGMLEDAKGNRPEAVKNYNKVLSLDNYATSHDEARQYITTPYTL